MKHKQFSCAVEKMSTPKGAKKRFKFVASTPQPDRSQDIIELAGWQVDNWKANPVVLWGHGHTAQGSLPIGKGIAVHKNFEKQALEIDIEFATEAYPFAVTVEKLVEGGYLNAVSVGFKPIKGAPREDVEDADPWFPPMRFMEQELLELSVVAVPANPNALLITNSVERDLMFQKGLVLGLIDAVTFQYVSDDEREAWMKAHDLTDFVPSLDFPLGKSEIGTVAFVKKDFNADTEAGCKWLEPAKGIRVRVRKPLPATGGVVEFKKLAGDIAAGWTSSAQLLNLDSTGNDGRIIFKEVYTTAIAVQDLQKAMLKQADDHHVELTKLIGELRDTNKAIAALYELVDAPIESAVTPAAKVAEGMSEQWLKEIRESVEAAKSVLGMTKE